MSELRKDEFYFESLDIIENFLHLLAKKEHEIRDLYSQLEELESSNERYRAAEGNPNTFNMDVKERFTTLIADPIPAMRVRLERILSQDAGCKVVGMAGNGEDLVTSYLKHKPDLVVSDIELPTKEEGYEALMKIKSENPDAIIRVISRHVNDDTLLRVMEIGAFDFILKPISHVRLVDNVNRIRKGA